VDYAAGLTDLVLAVAALGGGLGVIKRGERVGGLGLILLGLAAGLGAVRFCLWADAAVLHDPASWMAGVIGLPLVGLGMVGRSWSIPEGAKWVAVAMLIVVAAAFPDHEEYRVAAAGAGMLGGLVASAVGRRWSGVGGCVLVLAAGLALPPVCDALGVDFIPSFHLVMAVAAWLLSRGLSPR